MKTCTILFVSNDLKEITTMRSALENLRCRIVLAPTVVQAVRELIGRHDLNVVLFDLENAVNGLALLGAVHRCQPHLLFGVTVPHGSRRLYELAVLRGATILLEKPVNASVMTRSLPCLRPHSAGQQAFPLSNRRCPVFPGARRVWMPPKQWRCR